MRHFLIAILALMGAAAHATTYNYVGQPFTTFSGLCNASLCTSITGTVTFNFDTSSFTGTVSLAAVDSASVSEGIPSGLSGGALPQQYYTPVFPSSTIWFNPPNDTYGFTSKIAVGNFTFVDGTITSWLFGGGTGQVGCGGGPGCAIGSSDAVTTPTYDGGDIFTYATLNDSSASNSGGGVWIQLPVMQAVPEPSIWTMLLFGFAGLGALIHRRKHIALLRKRDSGGLALIGR